MPAGSLFDAIEVEEAVVRESVEELESRVGELMVRLEVERERSSRLVITWETTGELLARTTAGDLEGAGRDTPAAAEVTVSPFAAAERRVVGVVEVPKWRPGLEPGGAATGLPGHPGGRGEITRDPDSREDGSVHGSGQSLSGALGGSR
ncbi:hypothetical protein ACIBCO_37525 [Streptomyces violascens]|uniref:hypothetical protein n=1 Tax=Streptomyces violascens TaxID=67381 RepID=UPI0037A5E315